MDAARRGAIALEAGKSEEAIKEYTAAIAQNPKAVNYYIQRSIAYTRSKPLAPTATPAPRNADADAPALHDAHTSALHDAETATTLAYARANGDLMAFAQLRRAISLYSLGRYADSQKCLEWSENRNKKEKSLMIWKMKTEDQLAKLTPETEGSRITVKEVPDIDIENLTESLSSQTLGSKSNTTSSAAPTPLAPAPSASSQPSNIRHDWYQSTNTVTVSLMAKGVPKDKATVDIQPGSVGISFPLGSGADYDFSLEPLFAAIVPTESNYKVMSTKIELVLKKATPGQKWHSLEGTEPITATTGTTSADTAEKEAVKRAALSQPTDLGAPSYPTSSRSGPKNWDKVVDNIEKSQKEAAKASGDGAGEDYDDDLEGGDPANNFFKKLYKDADPDTRRAMMKSYQESNGTALSTNWSEVSQKTFETLPPDGMEAKKYEI